MKFKDSEMTLVVALAFPFAVFMKYFRGFLNPWGIDYRGHIAEQIIVPILILVVSVLSYDLFKSQKKKSGFILLLEVLVMVVYWFRVCLPIGKKLLSNTPL